MIRESFFSFIFLLLICVSCAKTIDERSDTQIEGLLAESERLNTQSRYDEAVEIAFDALRLADKQDKSLSAKSHLVLSKLFLQTSRDSLAWEHSCQAEDLASQVRSDSLRAAAILVKGAVCCYATVSEEENRDDEGIGYIKESLSLSEPNHWDTISSEAYYFLCELYINKNRWNDILDNELYKYAGEALDKAESLDKSNNSVRSMSTRMRYLRQGDRTDDAIDYCLRILESSPENDFLKRYQIYYHLTYLYLKKNNVQKGLEAHQNYSYYIQAYMGQKSDKILQDLQTEYRTDLKDRQIKSRTLLAYLLGLFLLLSLLVIFQFFKLNRQIAKKNKSIQSISRSREMLFAVIAKDLYDPSLTGIKDSQTLDFIRKWPTMPEEEIKRRCAELSEGEEPLDPVVSKYIADLMISRKKSLSIRGLSSRELEIISLSKEGLSDKQIADKLSLSTRTVSNHKYRIYSKLEVSGNSEMLAKAEELGI